MRILSILACLSLAACAAGMPPPAASVAAAPGSAAGAAAGEAALGPARAAPPLPAPAARRPEQFDTTSAADKAAAAARPAAAEARLGTEVVSLGDPADPGFWLETSLVTAETQGRVEDPATGKSVKVTLRPGGGGQMSLPAMRTLGVSLTDLPSVTVYGS